MRAVIEALLCAVALASTAGAADSGGAMTGDNLQASAVVCTPVAGNVKPPNIANPLSAKEVADMFEKATERIDFYWNFGVVFLTALIGWLISLKNPLTIPMKKLVSVVYVISALMNVFGLFGSYTFAEALRLDLLAMVPVDPKLLPNTRTVLEGHSFAIHRAVAIAIHIVVAIGVLAVLWGRSRPPSTTPRSVSSPPA
jgi:hypothetical protein